MNEVVKAETDDTDTMTIMYKGTEYNITDIVTINNALALLS